MSEEHENSEQVWLASVSSLTDEERWEIIDWRFHELCDVINTVRLENKQQAIPQRQGNSSVDLSVFWEEPEAGVKVRPWLQIPFDPSRDEQHFHEIWSRAVECAKKLKPMIADRKVDLAFVLTWGSFAECAGVIEHELHRGRPDLRYLKGAEKLKREQHKRWYSHVSARLKKPGETREKTDSSFIEFVRSILETGRFPRPEFDETWYRELMSTNEEQLTSALVQKNLSQKKMDELATSSLEDLPPIDDESYRP
ncbi:hypothetical protein WG622_11645 [Cognatishimia sp. D5M38]|jgi:hypothetical protein|uniref:Uncharacterized protein n=1 Tax=Cognatishimia coralii TaxID=3083254 RepID=A0ABU8QHM1_9RHOB